MVFLNSFIGGKKKKLAVTEVKPDYFIPRKSHGIGISAFLVSFRYSEKHTCRVLWYFAQSYKMQKHEFKIRSW